MVANEAELKQSGILHQNASLKSKFKKQIKLEYLSQIILPASV